MIEIRESSLRAMIHLLITQYTRLSKAEKVYVRQITRSYNEQYPDNRLVVGIDDFDTELEQILLSPYNDKKISIFVADELADEVKMCKNPIDKKDPRRYAIRTGMVEWDGKRFNFYAK